MTQIIQTLKICLRGGQIIEIPFQAGKVNELNPQIQEFIKALGDETKKDGKFLFQGQRMVLVRLSDVSSADIMSLIVKPKADANTAEDAAPTVGAEKESKKAKVEEKKEFAKKMA